MCRHQAKELHLVTVAAAVYKLKMFEGAVEEWGAASFTLPPPTWYLRWSLSTYSVHNSSPSGRSFLMWSESGIWKHNLQEGGLWKFRYKQVWVHFNHVVFMCACGAIEIQQSHLSLYTKCTITIKNTPPHTTTTTEGNSTKNAKADKKDSRDPDTESISTISTCSSTDEEGNWWEKQDNDKPPPPPPRTGLHSPFPSESTSVDDPVQISGVTGRSSPFDDFSSSIAQALFDNSKRRSDPFAATALANMSQDIRADSTQNGHRTKVQKTLSNPTSSRRPPPPKPPPYSGRGVALFYHEIEATKMGFWLPRNWTVMATV